MSNPAEGEYDSLNSAMTFWNDDVLGALVTHVGSTRYLPAFVGPPNYSNSRW